MAIREIPDGQDFAFDSDFGFKGSASGGARTGAADMQKAHMDRRDPKSPGYAKGGRMEHTDGRTTVMHGDGTHHVMFADGRTVQHHLDGGHTVVHPDGNVVQHHASGGMSVNHPSGLREEFHAGGGKTVHHLNGDVEHQDGSTMIGGMPHDDAPQDAEMIGQGVHEHEDALHPGEPKTPMDLGADEMSGAGDDSGGGYARGGHIGQHPRFPSRKMKPAANSMKSPMDTAPRNPTKSRTQPNIMPAGNMAYGVQPSNEPGNMGVNDQDTAAVPATPAAPDSASLQPAMRRGGKVQTRNWT